MNPTPEQIEQCAQVCYEAQRALLVSRGLATLSQAVPPPWHLALDSDKHAARERVCQVKDEGVWAEGNSPFEERLVETLASAFWKHFRNHADKAIA